MPALVKLPRSTSRLAAPLAYCRVVQRISHAPFQMSFEGPLFPSGREIPSQELARVPLVIECAGPTGDARRRGEKREILWILWLWESTGWRELGRAAAVNWEWAEVLRPVAEAYWKKPPGMAEVLSRGRDVAQEVLDLAEGRISQESTAVRKAAWASLYDRSAGRLVGEEDT